MAAVATGRKLASDPSWRRARMHLVRGGTRHALDAAHPVHPRNKAQPEVLGAASTAPGEGAQSGAER